MIGKIVKGPCSLCGYNRPYANKSKKLCSTCVKRKKKYKESVKRDAQRSRVTEKKLDTIFSRLVRTLYPPKCVTCNAALTFQTAQAGHFVSRRKRTTRWDIRNVHPQDAKCNVFNHGEQYKHGVWIDNFHGEGTADYLLRLGNTSIKFNQDDLRFMYDAFQEALNELERGVPQEEILRHLIQTTCK